MRSRTFIPRLVVCYLVAASPAIHAQGTPAARATESREHFAKAQKLVSDGKFAAAYDEFAAGYAASARPEFLFNMGECARQAGLVDQARQAYARYLEASPDGKLADLARRRLAEFDDAGVGKTAGGADKTAVTAPGPDAKTASAADSRGGVGARPPIVPALKVSRDPRPAAPAQLDLGGGRSRDASQGGHVWTRWPFWATAGSAVVVGAALVYAASRAGGDDVATIDWRR